MARNGEKARIKNSKIWGFYASESNIIQLPHLQLLITLNRTQSPVYDFFLNLQITEIMELNCLFRHEVKLSVKLWKKRKEKGMGAERRGWGRKEGYEGGKKGMGGGGKKGMGAERRVWERKEADGGGKKVMGGRKECRLLIAYFDSSLPWLHIKNIEKKELIFLKFRLTLILIAEALHPIYVCMYVQYIRIFLVSFSMTFSSQNYSVTL